MIRNIPSICIETHHEKNENFGYVGHLLVDGGRVFASGGSYGKLTLLASPDSGQTFVTRTTPPTSGLRSLSKIDGMLAVCGEHGTFALSDDAGLTWTPVPMPSSRCLFGVREDADGVRWVIGDGGFVARAPKGSLSFESVDSGTDTRLLRAFIVDKSLWILGFDGVIRVWKNEAFELLSVRAKKPLTSLAETPKGTIVVTGDGGTLLRSDNRGVTFERVASPVAGDLEDIVATPQGLLVVGDRAILFSDDDGRSFVQVPSNIDSHLWCIAQMGSRYFVGGDKGQIVSMTISPTETTSIDVPELPAPTEPTSTEDEGDNEDEEENEDASESALPSFASVEEASARWIREGKAFLSALNGYVDRVYSAGLNKAGEEPSDTRGDMADYVRAKLVELNTEGEHRRARELFPPAYEPFDYDRLGRPVRQIARLADGRTLVQVEDDVFVVERDRITELEEAAFFARSHDRQWVGLANGERLDIFDGLGGKKVRSLPLPAYGGGSVLSATITPDGDAALVATDGGVVWVGEHSSRLLMPENVSPGADFSAPSYLHAAMSPDGRFVAIGSQDSQHVLIDRKTGERHTFDTVSSYPHLAFFHETQPEVLFNSVHGLYGSGSLIVSLDSVVAGKGKSARMFDQRSWVFSCASLPDAYLLGDRSGYVWCVGSDGERRWHCFLGSSLTSMELSEDKKTLLVGSYAGYLVELDLTAEGRDPTLLTNGNLRETARWVFWRGHQPMIW